MMVFDKQYLLVLMKCFTLFSLVIISTTFFQVINFDNDEKLLTKKIEKTDKKSICLNDSSIEQYWNIQDMGKCPEIIEDFNLFYSLSENKYVYYSFAIFLGAVINLNTIIKVGIF